MIHRVHNILNFFPRRMRSEVRELTASSLILNFGLALIFIFEPIYLFKLGYSIQQIMLFWVIVYFFYVLALPLGGKVAEKFGYEHTIFLGTFFWILLYLCFYLIELYPIFFFITPLVYVLQKSTYWPAYHANFAKYSDDSEEGREIGMSYVLNSLPYIIGPLIGGWLLNEWGFHVLFVIVAIIFLLSNIPMLLTKEVFKPEKIEYTHSLKKMFSKDSRRSFFSYLGFGEEILVVVVWPIFMYLYIQDFFSLGGLVAIATFLTAIVILIIGRLSDKMDKRKIIKLGSAFYSLSWALRLFVKVPVFIFFTDTLSRISKNVLGVPLMAMTYENAKNHKVMNTVLLFEMSLAFGKFVACLLVFLLIFAFGEGLWPFYIVFIVAGLLTWLYTFLRSE